MSIPHPIPYQGSKRKLAPAILVWLPQDINRIIEPFAGSAAVSLAAAYHGHTTEFILNDINKPLMALWGEIIENPQAIADAYERLWEAQQGQEADFYLAIREQFNQTHRPDHFLYLLARCVKASVRYNAKGEFNQSPDNRRKGMQPKTLRQHIRHASQLFEGKTTLLATDFREVIAMAAPDDVIYLDPPYQGTSVNRDPRYVAGLPMTELAEILAEMNAQGLSYILSYDGRTGSKKHGIPLPDSLALKHIEINAGRSSQETLLGRNQTTYESLYLSSALLARLESHPLLQADQLLLPI